MQARRTRILILLAFVGPLLWCFGGLLGGSRVLAYRDTAHFYYPLYQWLTGVWGQWQLPLWNPLENTGTPIAAEATAAVFYPGKIVFTLPVSFALRFHLYILLHLILAGVSTYYVARTWRIRPVGAGLAAVGYAFSGSVLFQYCNVVFLVGAAWLPLSLLTADQMLRRRELRWAVLFGATLALMTLGGDPQSSYHAAMLAVLYAFVRGRDRRRGRARSNSAGPQLAWRARAPALLATAAASGLLLAAVQIVPAVTWTAASSRAVFAQPRSVFEIPGYLGRSGKDVPWNHAAAGLLGPPEPGTHDQQLYQFSVGPWRWLEVLWPNVSGRSFPENRRWMSSAIPADGRVWSPSLYMGLLPLLLGLGTWRLTRDSLRVRWLSWALLWSVLASLGWYGPVWLLSEWRQLGGEPLAAEHWSGSVGGLYWLMVVALPGYVYFRFPAKLLVIATLAISLLAGIGLDRLLRHRGDRPRAGCGPFAG